MHGQRYLAVLAVAVAVAMLAPVSFSASPLNGFLSTYMPNSTIGSSSFYSQSFNGSSYTIVQLPGINKYLVLLNSSGSYSFVTNASTAYDVLSPFLSDKYYPTASTIAELNSSMQIYRREAGVAINDCVSTTGVSLFDCTGQSLNTCLVNTCQRIPICGGAQKSPQSALEQYGVPSPFATGIYNLSLNYTRLNVSYNDYFYALSHINDTNAATMIQRLSLDTSNISETSTALSQNPLFSPPPNEPTCNPSLPVSQQPWYCVDGLFCSEINFNSTALSNVKSIIATMQLSLPSQPGIEAISSNSSKLASNYVSAYLLNKNGERFSALINSYYPEYNSLVGGSSALLAKYDNASLQSAVDRLESQFSAVQLAGANQSLAEVNGTLRALFANTLSIYGNASATYNQIYSISQNNTASLLASELSYRREPNKLVSLAREQQAINLQLDSGITSNDVASIETQVQSIRVESALYFAPFTLPYMVKALEGPFITSMLESGMQPVQQKISAAPSYAALETFIVDLIIIIIIFVAVYLKVFRKRKHAGKELAWAFVFIVLVALMAIDVYGSYASAVGANSFLPFNHFINSVRASNTTYIALNGSAASNASIGACASTISAYLSKASKTVRVLKLNNDSCVVGSNSSTLGVKCYDNILISGTPVIYISQSPSSSITYKGLYGTVLYSSGPASAGAECTLGTLFRNA